MSEEPESPFGLQLFEELRSRGALMVLTSNLNYAEIQEFKTLDRAGTAKVFHGSDYATVQMVKTGTPAEVASHVKQNCQLFGAPPGAAEIFILGICVIP